MDLFNKKLTLTDAMHYNSILDNGGIDTDVLLLWNSMNNEWKPGMADPTTKIITQPVVQPNAQIKVENKNPMRKYIKLPNATITKHIHKYR